MSLYLYKVPWSKPVISWNFTILDTRLSTRHNATSNDSIYVADMADIGLVSNVLIN